MIYLRMTALFVTLLIVFLGGCDVKTDEKHIGCQNDEIDEFGNCGPAIDNNVNLFSQDFSENIITKEVNEDIKGFIASPKSEEIYPGVIMIHEWWGLNDNIKYMAELLANEGYVVFAIDLYDGRVAEDAETAGKLAGEVRDNPEEAIETMKKAVQYLKDNYDIEKMASLGWCFGGQQSLQLSLNEDLDATVIYYGHLPENNKDLESINSPVLGIFGEEDTGIPVESVKSFEKSLNALSIENDIYVYPGVGHAFANPSGSRYAEKETIDAWEKTVLFLKENLK